MKYIFIFLWGSLVALIFFSQLKNQFIIPKYISEKVAYTFPQGWAFFTKNPKTEKNILVYEVINPNKILLLSFKNQSFRNRLGFSRDARVLGMESGFIASSFSKKKWNKSIYGNIKSINIKNYLNYELKSDFKFFKSGRFYVFVEYNTIPLAWSKLDQEKFNPIEYIVIKME